jgi:hypothetical protein
MQFSPDLRERVATGEITISIRLWKQPKVRAGGTYSAHGTTIVIDEIELLPFHAISDADVRASGELDREALRSRAAHAGPIADDTLVYRVEFHAV